MRRRGAPRPRGGAGPLDLFAGFKARSNMHRVFRDRGAHDAGFVITVRRASLLHHTAYMVVCGFDKVSDRRFLHVNFLNVEVLNPWGHLIEPMARNTTRRQCFVGGADARAGSSPCAGPHERATGRCGSGITRAWQLARHTTGWEPPSHGPQSSSPVRDAYVCDA
eukprot:gene42691-53373_t